MLNKIFIEWWITYVDIVSLRADGETPDGETPDGETPDGESPECEAPDVAFL